MTGPSERPNHQPAAGDSPPGIPRWLKLSALVVAVLIVLAIAIAAITGVQHGPGLHGAGAYSLAIGVA